MLFTNPSGTHCCLSVVLYWYHGYTLWYICCSLPVSQVHTVLYLLFSASFTGAHFCISLFLCQFHRYTLVYICCSLLVSRVHTVVYLFSLPVSQVHTGVYLLFSTVVYLLSISLNSWSTVANIVSHVLCALGSPLYSCSTERLAHPSLLGSKVYSSGHLRKTIGSQSDEFDLCLSTIRSVTDLHLVPSSGHFRLIRSRPTRQTLT